MTTPMTQWDEVAGTNSGNIFRWDTPGTVLEGTFQGGEPAGSKHNTLYTLVSPDGTEYKFWETLVLKERLDQVQAGQYIRIGYEGFRNKTKLFRVQIRKPGA